MIKVFFIFLFINNFLFAQFHNNFCDDCKFSCCGKNGLCAESVSLCECSSFQCKHGCCKDDRCGTQEQCKKNTNTILMLVFFFSCFIIISLALTLIYCYKHHQEFFRKNPRKKHLQLKDYEISVKRNFATETNPALEVISSERKGNIFTDEI